MSDTGTGTILFNIVNNTSSATRLDLYSPALVMIIASPGYFSTVFNGSTNQPKLNIRSRGFSYYDKNSDWEYISADTEYTAETNGWIYINRTAFDLENYVYLYIDGVVVFSDQQTFSQNDTGSEICKTTMIIPVFEGQVFYIEGQAINCRFAPCV